VTSVWRAADWYEREAHDLFGVHFEGHPDLSPLLLYEGFEGYPGRKEYPFNDYQEF
jgi:NADH-quinone oxidoreductase subunit C